jgi:hypothetical protein
VCRVPYFSGLDFVRVRIPEPQAVTGLRAVVDYAGAILQPVAHFTGVTSRSSEHRPLESSGCHDSPGFNQADVSEFNQADGPAMHQEVHGPGRQKCRFVEKSPVRMRGCRLFNGVGLLQWMDLPAGFGSMPHRRDVTSAASRSGKGPLSRSRPKAAISLVSPVLLRQRPKGNIQASSISRQYSHIPSNPVARGS